MSETNGKPRILVLAGVLGLLAYSGCPKPSIKPVPCPK